MANHRLKCHCSHLMGALSLIFDRKHLLLKEFAALGPLIDCCYRFGKLVTGLKSFEYFTILRGEPRSIDLVILRNLLAKVMTESRLLRSYSKFLFLEPDEPVQDPQ